MATRNRGLILPLLAGALALGACDGSTGPESGQTSILLAREAGASASIAPALSMAVSEALAGPVDLQEDVASIDITISAVQALRAGANEESEGEWVTVDLTTPTALNFLALPTDAATGGLEIAKDKLSAGTYGNVRLLFSAATITFKREVKVGQVTYPANQPIELTIPSNRIKVPVTFTVNDQTGATVKLVFDADASVEQIVATGANKIIMPPVLHGSEVEED